MVVAALNNAVEPAPITVAVPAVTMQYTYQSLIEVRQSHTMHLLFGIDFLNQMTAYQKHGSVSHHI